MATESLASGPPGPDDLEIPFIFVPHGAPEPTEWMAAHPGWVKFPAVFVPHGPRADEAAEIAPVTAVTSIVIEMPDVGAGALLGEGALGVVEPAGAAGVAAVMYRLAAAEAKSWVGAAASSRCKAG